MPKYRRGSGSVYLKRDWCYIKYYVNGDAVTEATGTKNKAEARRILQARLGQVAEGRYLGPEVERVTFEELAQGVVTDYEVNNRKDVRMVKSRIKNHLAPFFGGRKAHAITTTDIQEYIRSRRTAEASNAAINRDLAALKRMFNLALRAERIAKKPYIPKLEEDNARQGFFERWEFENVLARIPDFLRPPINFAYYTGWRVNSEILPLTWDRVDLDEGTVRLYQGMTKNKDGRLIHLPQVLREVLEQQWRTHLERFPECSWVFNNNGERIKYFRRRWLSACKDAGLVGKIPHDFRRTAVRNLVRAGVPERVAMQICGHKTRSVFDRYNIVSGSDLRDAARRIDETIARLPIASHEDKHKEVLAS